MDILERASLGRTEYEGLLQMLASTSPRRFRKEMRELDRFLVQAKPIIAFLKGRYEFFGDLGKTLQKELLAYRDHYEAYTPVGAGSRHRPDEPWLTRPAQTRSAPGRQDPGLDPQLTSGPPMARRSQARA